MGQGQKRQKQNQRLGQNGSALLIGAMALLGLGLAAMAMLRVDGPSASLDHAQQASQSAQRLRTAVDVYAVRHAALPAPSVSARDLGLAPGDLRDPWGMPFLLSVPDGGCGPWSLSASHDLHWSFPSPGGCQPTPARG